MKADKRELQRRIAYEAARILTEQRSGDYAYASRKAANRLGLNDLRQMPRREEIEEALREQQRLFLGEQQTSALQQLQRDALEAMHALSRFLPLLVGAVQAGTADRNSAIQLLLFADTPEEVIFALSDLNIPWRDSEHLLRFGNGHPKPMPSFRFRAGESAFELIVLPPKGRYSRPLEPGGDQPIRGINRDQLSALLSQAPT
ncbi:hypothetical protein [endosymbiont of Riftia pachyptila]|uniref:Nucleotidyltransferase n=1 Tax=endosymbiont of Riftia pachyptila (vent Ph05) TaxID=1048808 RepID=G2D926_9GAMM|nr:hypothetical protein [endosymbiont of Riftia pachyptila]EGV52893.1 hypothetical protein Rifp1Sym_aa00510 [endosymbiont of Riftia pachyptila (vent Ph05)]